MNALASAESPAQHRYPVWWTGDMVDLEASTESMVNSGLHDMKPFVHSDCGGDRADSKDGGSLVRWTAHSVFGTILRFHGATDALGHRPWMHGPFVESVIKSYLLIRYRLIPSLVAAGRRATDTGFPLVARGDLYWPEHSPNSSSARQYIFLDDVLVAPIFELDENVSSRDVWIPPGDWQDVWTGELLRGPQILANLSQPFDRQPMWHRRGGLLVLSDSPSLRVDDQDWSTLTLDAYPSVKQKSETKRRVVERLGNGADTHLVMRTDDLGRVTLEILAAAGAVPRAWVFRLHLLPGQQAKVCFVDGHVSTATHINPGGPHFFPFGGAGSAPARGAGTVVEIKLPSGTGARSASVQIVASII